MTADEWDVEFYENERGVEPMKDWLKDLDPSKRAAAVGAIEVVLTRLGTDVCNSEWGKHLGHGLYELRIRHDAGEIHAMFDDGAQGSRFKGRMASEVLLRIYFTTFGHKVILLLAGYDKGRFGAGRREQKAIKTARRRLADVKRR